jgi:electron transport complex protein RnfG
MKMILTIIFRLTVSCLIAGTIMGMTFVFTNKAKKANEHAREEKVMYALLGYGEDQEPDEGMALHEIFRYIVADGVSQSIGYLLPAGHHGEDAGFVFIQLSLEGDFVSKTDIPLNEEKAREQGDRDNAVQTALGSSQIARFVDQVLVVTEDGSRKAYLLSGKFPGYKTNISIILALDPTYSIIGFEVMEHEEDPGLGAEIEQDYFKNQFKRKPLERIKQLKVVKEPLPDEYYNALEGKMELAAAEQIMQQYSDNDIYAITGSTISSDSVTSGIRGMTKKIAYRLDTLEKVLEAQQIGVPF